MFRLDSLWRTYAQDFYVMKKSIDMSRVWTLDLEAIRFLEDHLGRQGLNIAVIIKWVTLIFFNAWIGITRSDILSFIRDEVV